MNTQSYKTKSAKKHEVNRKWFLVDAEGEVVGRLASKIAHVLRGKHKPSFTPHVDCGDNIIVVNADKVRFTGNKEDDKKYSSYSGYPGGLKQKTAANMRKDKPEAIIEKAVKGMLPKNKLGAQMFTKLFVYAGGGHPHAAQQPQPFKF